MQNDLIWKQIAKLTPMATPRVLDNVMVAHLPETDEHVELLVLQHGAVGCIVRKRCVSSTSKVRWSPGEYIELTVPKYLDALRPTPVPAKWPPIDQTIVAATIITLMSIIAYILYPGGELPIAQASTANGDLKVIRTTDRKTVIFKFEDGPNTCYVTENQDYAQRSGEERFAKSSISCFKR